MKFGEEQRNQSEIGDVANNQIVVVDAVNDPLDVAPTRSILFTIKKTLTQSDTNSLCRLLQKKYVVLDHILPYLNEEQKRDVNNGEGTAIVIKDVDEYHQSAHHLIFKKSQKSGSYILKSNWKSSKTVGKPTMISTKNVRRRLGYLKKKLSSSIKSLKVPEGHVPVYVGEMRTRYVIPLHYLSTPILKDLLEESEEFGEKSQGPIWLPCKIHLFEEVLKHIKDEERIAGSFSGFTRISRS
ncbi:hypothetical protein IFM89_011752 [Coptis chinensis]|uniref:Uncharacterized protein n=1 Tax=Coptis chinensis TaxID=261450 RepID=A0A835MB03_9MAGN|nr:hypothetical protein IFM89_011752 [Coptis chinensis]